MSAGLYGTYNRTGDDRGEAIHSDGITIEECRLSDDSYTYNVVLRDLGPSDDDSPEPTGSGLQVRFACEDERKAWALADELGECAWFEDINALSPERSKGGK